MSRVNRLDWDFQRDRLPNALVAAVDCAAQRPWAKTLSTLMRSSGSSTGLPPRVFVPKTIGMKIKSLSPVSHPPRENGVTSIHLKFVTVSEAGNHGASIAD